MVVSFKLSKTRKRFNPKPALQSETQSVDAVSENSKESSPIRKREGDDVARISPSHGGLSIPAEHEVSFTLNLYLDGYFIGKPSEKEVAHEGTHQDVPKSLHPYDRSSETLFSAIESGRLPGDILDDIPCKYVDGSIVCEVRDYRNFGCEQGSTARPMDGSPIVHKVRLKMSLENVVKDIPLITDNSWTYGDLMLNLVLNKLQRKRVRQMPEVTETSSNIIHEKKVCIDRVPESSNSRLGDVGIISGNMTPSHVNENLITQNLSPNQLLSDASVPTVSSVSQQSRYQIGVGIPRGMQEHESVSDVNPSGASPGGQDMTVSYPNKLNSNPIQVKEIQDMAMPFDADKVDGSELNRGRNDMQMVGTDESNMDPQQSRFQQRIPQHAFMRAGFPQATWNNVVGQHIEKDPGKEDQFQKRKSAQRPSLSAGALPQSPLLSKSGEFSSGSVGAHFGAVSTSAALGASQKDKSTVNSVPPVGGTQSLTSSANDSIQQQHQALAGKRRSNSLPETPVMSGVGSPVSVSNMSVPLNENSPSVGTQPLADQTILDRFTKIQAAGMSFCAKKNKVDDYPIRKPPTFSTQKISSFFSNSPNNEDIKNDKWPLSKSLVGGSRNVCKTRVINFKPQEHIVQENVASTVHGVHPRMIMSEKSKYGTVAMYCGDIEDGDILPEEDQLRKLPNTRYADLLARQYCSLMSCEGFHVDDCLQAKPVCMNIASTSQPNPTTIPPTNSGVEMQQYAEAVGQASGEVAKPTSSGNTSLNSSQNLLAGARMLPSGNPQALKMSQGLLSGVSVPARPQQLDQQPSLKPQSQQPQQPPNQHSLIRQQQQFQGSQMMLGANPLSHFNAIGQKSNMQLGNHMVNKSSLQPQLLQPQQQQAQMQKKMMMELAIVGMVNMGNNMVGLGGLGNAMSMGGARGIGGTEMSAPMAPISNMGNMGQNMNPSQASNLSNAIRQQLRSGKLTPQQAALAQKLDKMRTDMIGGRQSSIAGISGARQMLAGSSGVSSMLGQNLNQACMSPLQQTAMGPMGLPKSVPGMNLYMNQQQQMQLLQQLQQQPKQQQETTSPLQAVVSPLQVGSPLTMGIPQLNQQVQSQQPQQNPMSTQQLNQRTPVSSQMRSGAINAISTGNPELISQTLGLVGSITNSRMELQGVNKSNSFGNG